MERIRADAANPIDEIRYVDLRQSMQNGGGPACLRLRVLMTQQQIASVKARTHVFADDHLLKQLEQWAETHYPESLKPEDLGDPALYHHCKTALEALTGILKVPVMACV